MNQTELGTALGLDKTTMSRNLRVMLKRGWIQAGKVSDRRVNGYEITAEGKRAFERARTFARKSKARIVIGMSQNNNDVLTPLRNKFRP